MLNRSFGIILVLSFVCWLITYSTAQDKPKLDDRTRQRIEIRLKNMVKEVGLKPDQMKKIEEILVADAMINPVFDRDLSREERMELMQKRREDQEKINKKIEQLLTADQVEKFNAFIEKENSRRRGRKEKG